jgi:hypothetical protein
MYGNNVMDLTSSGLRSIMEGAIHEHFADLVHGFGGVVFEDFLPDLIPNVLLRIELGRMRRQPGQGDVRGNCKLAALMVARPVHD